MAEEQSESTPDIQPAFSDGGGTTPSGEGWLSKSMENVSDWMTAAVERASTHIPLRVSSWWDRVVEEPGDRAITEYVDDLERRGLDPEVAEELRKIAFRLPRPLDWLVLYLSVVRLSLARMSAWFDAIKQVFIHDAVNELRPTLAQIGALVTYAQRFPNRYDEVDRILSEWGLPDSQKAMEFWARQTRLTSGELMGLVNRDHLSLTGADEYLRRSGMTDDDAERLLELRLFYPGPSDLATLAGREAFEEDQISAFGLDANFEDIPEEVYAKAGVPREIMRWYWIAHWQNPSIQQFFDMVHRRAPKTPSGERAYAAMTPEQRSRPNALQDSDVWTVEDVEDYARLADINPTFVPGLSHIAYRPLTRVDVRRMYQDDVLDEDGVLKSYLDLGYSETDAELMTRWTIKYAQRNERSLTRTQIESMYELRQIDRSQLQFYLESIGYTQAQAHTIALLAEAKREEQRLRSFVSRSEYEYKRGIVDRNGVERLLIEEDVAPDQVSALLSEWDNEAVVEQSLPSKADLLDWLAGPDFTPEQFRVGMRALRYSDPNIDRYLQQIGARLSKTDVLRLYDQGEIDEAKGLRDLLSLGYSEVDAGALLRVVSKRIARREEIEQAQAAGG